MRFLYFFMALAAVVALAFGSPIVEEGQDVDIMPRVACDLIGNERLCVLHCYALGKSGGYCDGQKVCNCR